MHATHGMSRTFLALTVLLTVHLGLPLADVTELSLQVKQHRVIASYGQLPLYFIENKGQMDQRVKFYARSREYTLSFTEEGLHLSSPQCHSTALEPSSITLAPLGMKRGGEVVAEEPQVGKMNYFIGNDPQQWKTNIPTYRAVVYREAYPGIDLKFYGNSQQVEYDVVIKPGGDPSQVTFQVSGGIAGLEVTGQGDLSIRLQDGSVVGQRKPILYQEIDGKRVQVEGKFTIYSDVSPFVYGFEVATYDTTSPLIIDPSLSYSTFLGGHGEDLGYAIAVDNMGHAYMTGQTSSLDFPTHNPLQSGLAGDHDVFVTKLTATGDALVYSTFLGGSRTEASLALAVDSSGNVYVTGQTRSLDFPTQNPFQPSLHDEFYTDAFVAKLNASGDVLAYSTYLGGSGSDRGASIAVDTEGNAYVTGSTSSPDFPTTPGAFQTHLPVGGGVFVTKLNAAGSMLVYSTYLGNAGGYSITVDTEGNAYVTGSTSSPDFPTTPGAFQTHFGGGQSTAFVTKLNVAGSALVYSTYLGGSVHDEGYGIAVDGAGNTHVAGRTLSPDFPTRNALQSSLGGAKDGFVTKLNAAGSALLYSTYLGGRSGLSALPPGFIGLDDGFGIAVDGAGNAYISGITQSTDFPIKDPLQGRYAGEGDVFVTKLNTAGELLYSTYLGGSSEDSGYAIAVDSLGNAYVIGTTKSIDFPTRHPFQGIHAGARDVFIAKIVAASLPEPPDMPLESFYVTNGPVRTIEKANGIVYLGGDFTEVGPLTGAGVAIDAATGVVNLALPKVTGGAQTVNAVVSDGAGGWYIGGNFTQVGEAARNHIAHILANGSVDHVWVPNTDSPVYVLAIAGNTVYAGGEFTSIGGQVRNRVAALSASTGTATPWNPNVNGIVRTLAISQNTIYIGGDFTSVAGQTRNRLAAVDASTGTATAWNPNANGAVHALAVPGATVYTAGEFTSISGQARNRIAAVDATTGQATAWNPNANGIVRALVLSGTAVYTGGEFTTIGGQTRNRIAALSATTGSATSWNPNANNVVRSLAVSGSIVYAGGDFAHPDGGVTIGGRWRNRVAALDTITGDATPWNPNANNLVRALAVAGTVVYAGGNFTGVNMQVRDHLAALEANTGVVTPWYANAHGTIRAIHALAVAGGTVYVGGDFTVIDDQPRNDIAALDAITGQVIPWNPNANGIVHTLALSGPTVYAGGEFTSIGGQVRNRVAALSATAGTATPWNPNANGTVEILQVSGDTVYVGGQFTVIGGQPRSRIAALDVTGGNATLWAPDADSTVRTLAIGGTTVYAGGDFTVIGGAFRNRLAAIDINTDRATSWDPNANDSVLALLSAGSTVIAVGRFTTIGNRTRNRLAALDATIGAAGEWNPNADNMVRTLLLSGTTLYAGGDFTHMDGQPRSAVAAFPMQDVPRLGLVANQALLHVSDTLALNAVAMPGAVAASVDVYIALLLPDATLLFWQGGVNFTRAIMPIVHNWRVGSFREEIFRYTFKGGEPSGNYTWLGAFTQPGTFNILGDITHAPFIFRP